LPGFTPREWRWPASTGSICTSRLAVKDLLSAVPFAVQPLDDLNLAALLVSPLIGWTREQLYELAYGRKGAMWAELATSARTASALESMPFDPLRLAGDGRLCHPGRFIETILSGPVDGRRKLLRRLGEAARDPIEELVATALASSARKWPRWIVSWPGSARARLK
jgi:ATP-dependent helicase/nuclease subunit A